MGLGPTACACPKKLKSAHPTHPSFSSAEKLVRITRTWEEEMPMFQSGFCRFLANLRVSVSSPTKQNR